MIKLVDLKPNKIDIDYLKSKNREYKEIIKKNNSLIELNNIIINSYERCNNNYYNIFKWNNVK